MNRICKITLAVLFILTLPIIMVSGQDKKNEQKIKVIVDDGSGTRVIIDTVYKDGPAPDSIIVRDGSVIYINHPDDGMYIKHNDGTKHLSVTYSSDDKDKREQSREITVISSDSKTVKAPGREFEDTSDEYVINSDNESSVEKSRFVIARDGIVVTVEGNDEAKTKALVKEIENKMGVRNDAQEKKETVKIETKKTIKK
jgi:hypothetical protein